MKEQTIDPVLVSILQKRLESIALEMGHTLLRTAKSPIWNEAMDFATGIYGPNAEIMGQAEYIPILALAIPSALSGTIEYYRRIGEKIYEGDIILHNDVFAKGNQLTDITVLLPFFYNERLVAWLCAKGHLSDIGGNCPGGYNPAATETWQEGIRITPVKVYEKGKLRKDVWDLIFANQRLEFTPDDVLAAIGGVTLGKRKLKEVLDKYGLDIFENHISAMYDASEMMVRKEISAIPDGVYKGESFLYHDAIGPGKWCERVTITVTGDEMTLDWSDSSPSTRGFLNQAYGCFLSGMWVALFQIFEKDIPHNHGMLRPVHIINPEGLITNVEYPKASVAGNHLTNLTCNAIMQALQQAVPERVYAAWCRDAFFYGTGINPRTGNRFADIGFLAMKGGGGASYSVDGWNHIGINACSGTLIAQDPEMFEFHNPIFVEGIEYDKDSAGPGRWRGGFGTQAKMILQGEDMFFVQTSIGGFANGEGDDHFGIFGGMAGSPNKVLYLFPDGTEKKLEYGLGVINPCPKGTKYLQIAGGGGGYGSPFLRPIEKVLEEVRDGLVSSEQAEKAYGVVIEGDLDKASSLKVNEEETQKLRKSRTIVPLPKVKNLVVK